MALCIPEALLIATDGRLTKNIPLFVKDDIEKSPLYEGLFL